MLLEVLNGEGMSVRGGGGGIRFRFMGGLCWMRCNARRVVEFNTKMAAKRQFQLNPFNEEGENLLESNQ
jgi:hypothetical protein